jgi:hypothetical protein
MTYRPKTQADCDHANALREYESAHARWMSLSVFTDAGMRARIELAAAREKLTAAVKVVHPTWIVM